MSAAVNPYEAPWRSPVRASLGGETDSDEDGRGKERGKLDERKRFSHHAAEVSSHRLPPY
jgi:hypothetical protein